MKPITKEAWDRVFEIACDIANAAVADDDVLFQVHTDHMLDLLDELDAEFGAHSRLLDTRADYLSDPDERRLLYQRALALAEECQDEGEIKMIRESIRELDAGL